VTDPTRAPGSGDPHRRFNPLTDEWILVSAERTRRPWLGHSDEAAPPPALAYDPTCYLCPGNVRARGSRNPDYAGTLVFENDFAALRPTTDGWSFEDGLLRAASEQGTCRVICFSPRHDVGLGSMALADVRRVVDVWAEQTTELGQMFRWVQVFENRGEMMGASNPHPHGQVWAAASLPREAGHEDAAQRRYFERSGRQLLLDYADQERGGVRVVDESDRWLTVVPFWAVWPFETLVVPKRKVGRLADLSASDRNALAGSLIRLLTRYDSLFQRQFPYSMGWHQAPFVDGSTEHWQLHAHFYPPLLQASTRKFMVGYELLSETQRDITAESAAELLRDAPSELTSEVRSSEAHAVSMPDVSAGGRGPTR
jgi:UDPglucose--hexose-1-phosphate uridylyltransferase